MMARRSETTRLGMVGLLMLVIAICLAVLGALAVVTAHGDAVMSKRHADSVALAAKADAVAQEFVAGFDGWLAETTSSPRASSANVTYVTLMESLEERLDALLSDALEAGESAQENGTVIANAVALEPAGLRTYLQSDEAVSDYLCGVHAAITVDGTRSLDLVVAATRSLDAEVIVYTLTTEWADQPSAQKLWEG